MTTNAIFNFDKGVLTKARNKVILLLHLFIVCSNFQLVKNFGGIMSKRKKEWEYPWDKSHPIESICLSIPMFVTMIATMLTFGALSLFCVIKSIQPFTPIWNVTMGFCASWIGSTILFDGGMAWHAIREKLEYKKTLRWLEKHKNDYNEVDKEDENLTQSKLESDTDKKSNERSHTTKSNQFKMERAYNDVIANRKPHKSTIDSHSHKTNSHEEQEGKM